MMEGMDFSMGGALQYKEIAIANANQTYATQLAQLKTTFDTLTDDEKMRSAITIGKEIFQCCNTQDGYFGEVFAHKGGNLYFRGLSMTNTLYKDSSFNGTTWSMYDISSYTNSEAMRLMLLS